MTREFSVVREMGRRELERHQKRFIGVTINAPEFRNVKGKLEWVCDVRVGVTEGWAVVKNVLIAEWAIGVVTDMNIPVLCERSVAGRVTIIARSEVRLPDIRLTSYSYFELGLLFMTGLQQDGQGVWRDGYGHAMDDPTLVGGTGGTIENSFELIPWGDPEFIYGTTRFGAMRPTSA